MATKEEDFRERFVAMMHDLHANGAKDQEAQFLIGSLASRLMAKTGARSWPAFKTGLGSFDRAALLTDFEKQGNKYHKDGKRKHAYAVQVLAMSVIAPSQTDKDVLSGNKILDGIVNSLVTVYRKAEAATKPN
jgi:hypothetical protein